VGAHPARLERSFSFIELYDGSCQGSTQVIAPNTLANYEAVVKQLHPGERDVEG